MPPPASPAKPFFLHGSANLSAGAPKSSRRKSNLILICFDRRLGAMDDEEDDFR
jgi:hypothetical protein